MSGMVRRMTRQRRIILDTVTKQAGHWTADEVFTHVRRIMPTISLATVYRNLEALESMGLIAKLESAGSSKRYDGNPEDHYHIQCISCGTISDVPGDMVKSLIYRTDQIEGFSNISATVHFSGICDDCIDSRSPEGFEEF